MTEKTPAPPPPAPVSSGRTTTRSFGTSKRESHDASGFYARFVPPTISDDDTVVAPDDRPQRNAFLHGDARNLLADETLVRNSSVALVVTSPPYFVGKTYEEAMGQGHVPAEYSEHLASLHEVFARCADKLEPGGRIAVNVANLGRKPYRSQAADIIRIFEDLGLLVRGEIIWKKGDGMNSSTAWGSFQKPSNPVLRDLTERIVVASKGRFDRALSSRKREELGLPSEGSIFKEEFMSATKDVWEIPAESATRVGHPAPFPVDLPKRLIDLYTYRNDLVLDPYMGSGSTAVAAIRKGREFVGCDTDTDFIALSKQRVVDERARLKEHEDRREKFRVVVPAVKPPKSTTANATVTQMSAIAQGQKAEEIAAVVLNECGFTVVKTKAKLRSGPVIDIVANDRDGNPWHFDVTGAFTSERDGLRRTDTVWKSLGKAAVRKVDDLAEDGKVRYVLLTTSLPPGGAGLKALRSAQKGDVIWDALEMLAEEHQVRLAAYADGIVDQPRPIGASQPDALF